MAVIGNSLAPYFTAVSTDVFSANGTGNTFSLSRNISNLGDIEVVVNNIQQNPYSGSYSVSGNTLTFSEAPLSGSNNVVVTYRQATLGSTIPTPNTVGNNVLQRDLSLTGNTTTQHLVPAANITYDIGTTNMRYRDLYLSGNTINLGDIKLSTNGTAFSVANATGGVFASALGNTVITGTLTSNAHTMTGNLSVTGNTVLTGTANVTGNLNITSTSDVPLSITSSSNVAHTLLQSSNSVQTYVYHQLTATSAGEGHGYLIKNGNTTGNGLANGSLYLWNDGGTDKGIEFVPSGDISLRTTVSANGSIVSRGHHHGLGNTTPYNSRWGANSHQLTIGSNKAYSLITLNGNGGSTSWSTGSGDDKYYMAYDNVNQKHHIYVNTSNGIQFPYQLHIHGTPGNGTRGSAGLADRFTTNYNRGTLTFSNSRITVPIAGVYLIIFQTICDAGSGRIDTEIRVNGTVVSSGLNNASDGTSDYRMRTHSVAIQLSASDYIQFYHGYWYATGNTYDNWGVASVTLLG